jgi:hypothetical protein
VTGQAFATTPSTPAPAQSWPALHPQAAPLRVMGSPGGIVTRSPRKEGAAYRRVQYNSPSRRAPFAVLSSNTDAIAKQRVAFALAMLVVDTGHRKLSIYPFLGIYLHSWHRRSCRPF